jgi:hypothetical protein
LKCGEEGNLEQSKAGLMKPWIMVVMMEERGEKGRDFFPGKR